jgi:hypothetical protein
MRGCCGVWVATSAIAGRVTVDALVAAEIDHAVGAERLGVPRRGVSRGVVAQEHVRVEGISSHIWEGHGRSPVRS